MNELKTCKYVYIDEMFVCIFQTIVFYHAALNLSQHKIHMHAYNIHVTANLCTEGFLKVTQHFLHTVIQTCNKLHPLLRETITIAAEVLKVVHQLLVLPCAHHNYYIGAVSDLTAMFPYYITKEGLHTSFFCS